MGRKDSKAKAPATESDHEEEVIPGESTDEVCFDFCTSRTALNEACWLRFRGSPSALSSWCSVTRWATATMARRPKYLIIAGIVLNVVAEA